MKSNEGPGLQQKETEEKDDAATFGKNSENNATVAEPQQEEAAESKVTKMVDEDARKKARAAEMRKKLSLPSNVLSKLNNIKKDPKPK